MTPQEYRKTEKGRKYRARAAFRRRQRQKSFIDNLKINMGCAQCGYSKCAAALDFDHIKKKSKSVASLTGQSRTRILEEIKKCQLFCANCHREKTLKCGEYYQANNKYFFNETLCR